MNIKSAERDMARDVRENKELYEALADTPDNCGCIELAEYLESKRRKCEA